MGETLVASKGDAMAGRLAWILAGGAAIVGGMIVQDREWISFDDRSHEERVVKAREARSEAERLRVTVAGERDGEVDPESVRAMTRAVGDLVRTEAALALAEAGDDQAEIGAARERRDRAKARVDELKAEIQRQAGDSADEGREAAIRDTVRQEIRDGVRDAVRN
jgi:hypothetical protein